MIAILKDNSYFAINNILTKEWLEWQGLTENELPADIQFVLNDDHPLAPKILSAEYGIKPVTDSDGNLIDIIQLPPPEAPIDEVKERAIQQTRDWVEAELKKGMPYPYPDGKIYNVTREKRADLAGVILVGKMNEENGVPDDKNILRWNVSGEEHENWLYKDLCALAYTMYIFVTPTIEKQQHAEIQIKGAETYDEIQAILQDFM